MRLRHEGSRPHSPPLSQERGTERDRERDRDRGVCLRTKLRSERMG
jgi:uncharacterized membrane protein